MEKDIKLIVTGIHLADGEEETIKTECSGQYHLKNGKHYFIYEEDTEQGNVKSIIKVQEETIEVIKKGAVNMHLFFEPDKVISCTYDTPFGSIPIDVYTRYINIFIDHHHIKVVVEYDMLNNNEVMSKCKLLVDGRN